jgi:hypothetical protein
MAGPAEIGSSATSALTCDPIVRLVQTARGGLALNVTGLPVSVAEC